MHKAAPNKSIVPTVINGQSGRLYRNKRLSTRRCLSFNCGSVDKKKQKDDFVFLEFKSTLFLYFGSAHLFFKIKIKGMYYYYLCALFYSILLLFHRSHSIRSHRI